MSYNVSIWMTVLMTNYMTSIQVIEPAGLKLFLLVVMRLNIVKFNARNDELYF